MEEAVHQLRAQEAAPSDITAALKEADKLRRRLMKQCLKDYQFDWVEKQREWKILTRGRGIISDGKTDLLDILSRIMPEHGRLRKTMTSNRAFSEEERRQNILDLCALASKNCTVLYRPGEDQITSICPAKGCNVHMSR